MVDDDSSSVTPLTRPKRVKLRSLYLPEKTDATPTVYSADTRSFSGSATSTGESGSASSSGFGGTVLTS